MTRRRWIPIAGSGASYAYERVERAGVGALVVRLRGASGDRVDDVARVRDALDELAATIEPEVEVAALDVSRFSNAYGDEAGNFTSVFAGLACCWATPECDMQVEGQRWHLPHAAALARTLDAALARALSLRAAGAFTHGYAEGAVTIEHRWTERGFETLTRRDGRDDMRDLHHRNRLVERALFGDHARRVRWPFADRTGVAQEAQRRGARLVYKADRVVEADFGPWQTRRPLGDDWVARVADLTDVERLVLLDTSPADDDLARAVEALARLKELRLDRERITDALVARLRAARPGLAVR